MKKVLTPPTQHEAMLIMRTETAISERRACELVGVYRSVLRYASQQSTETTALRVRIVELAQERRRFGYRRIKILTVVDAVPKKLSI